MTNRHVNAIAGRLSLRPPQRRSLEILDRITEIAPPKKGADPAAALEAIRSEYPSVTDFEREFPSLCFALATGVGKTRLMGAFISYLHLAHGINNFFVLAPNLTIYNKLIADFAPNTPKDVFRGIAEFATDAPEIITGDTYEAKAGGGRAARPGCPCQEGRGGQVVQERLRVRRGSRCEAVALRADPARRNRREHDARRARRQVRLVKRHASARR